MKLAKAFALILILTILFNTVACSPSNVKSADDVPDTAPDDDSDLGDDDSDLGDDDSDLGDDDSDLGDDDSDLGDDDSDLGDDDSDLGDDDSDLGDDDSDLGDDDSDLGGDDSIDNENPDQPHTHSYGKWSIVSRPSCTVDGLLKRSCSCGIYEEKPLEAEGHEFSDWRELEPATCKYAGLRTRSCSCGETETGPIGLLDHNFNDWSLVESPTYQKVGLETRSCDCGATESREIPRLGMLFEDNFDGTDLDYTKWSRCPEWERQGGDSIWDSDMSYVDGEGHLVLRAEWDEENNRVICGAVRTEGLFLGGYGYYEASIKFPVVKGMWGAFWLMCGDVNNVDGSAADGVEIDIIESIYNDYGGCNNALHYDGYGNGHVQVHSGTMYNFDIYDGNFHTFALERTSTSYVFYIDGVKCWQVNSDECDICPELGFMKLTLEAAEWAGSGSAQTKNALPAEMLVDYVRVYSENPYK